MPSDEPSDEPPDRPFEEHPMTATLIERHEPAESHHASHLRLLPIPDTEPAPDLEPYPPDLQPGLTGRDEPAGDQPQQPALALALVPAPPVRFESFGPRATPTRELPDPQAWTRRLVQAMVEVLSGVRPPAQLARWTSPDVYAGLQRRIAPRGRPARVEAGRRPVVRSVHVCQPADGVVEACAVLVGGSRVRAVALRLEGLDGRWRMTAVQLG